MTRVDLAPGPIAYLTGEYPKVSHTFILREIAVLRRLGADILPCTVRRAPPKQVVGADQLAARAETFGILETVRRAPHRLLLAHLGWLLRAPGRWLAALRLAWRTRSPGTKAALYQLFYFLEAGLLADHLRRKGVVHLHNHFGDSSCTVAMLTSVISGIPYSYTMHGPAIFYEPRRWRIDEKIARARFVACISHFCRSQGMYFSDPVHWPKLRIVHCGVDPAAYGRRERRTFGKRVLFVGRLDPVKGAPLLIEAFARAAAEHPDASLTVVGDGPSRAQAETMARDLGLADRVAFLGFRSQAEVADLLEEADMLVLPSFAEGVPVVLMEAMASRIPVVASLVAGIPELVEDGVSGHLVPPGDVATLAARIAALMADPDRARAMGLAGRAKVEAEFDLAKEGAWLLRLHRGEVPEGQLRPEAPG